MSTPPKEKPADRSTDHINGTSLPDERQERGYYYDDAHGYEKYDPETDDEGEDDRAKKKPGA